MKQVDQPRRFQFKVVNFFELAMAIALLFVATKSVDVKPMLVVFCFIYSIKLLLTLVGFLSRSLGVALYLVFWVALIAIGMLLGNDDGNLGDDDGNLMFFIAALWFALIPTLTFADDLFSHLVFRTRVVIWRTFFEVLLMIFVWLPCWVERVLPFLQHFLN